MRSSSVGAKETARVEVFSDGVFAIAVTLLSLELRVPHGAGRGLAAAIAHEWPGFLAFVTSFATVAIMWINHHRLFMQIRRVDHGLLLWNSFLLMAIALVPFSNALVAEYLGRPGQETAAMIYAATFVIVTALFNLVWRHSTHHALVEPEMHGRAIRRINRQYGFGPPLYVVSFVIALFSAIASVALDVGIAAFFALPALFWARAREIPLQARQHSAG